MRIIALIFIVFCVAVMSVYFSDSYRLGREANEAFEGGDYEGAYQLATQAMEKDPYNRFAYGISSQAKQRLNVQKFLNATKANYTEAFELLKSGVLSPREFLQLRWMVEEFNRNYRELLILNQPTAQENEQLEQYKKWFLQLEKRLNEVKNAPQSQKK